MNKLDLSSFVKAIQFLEEVVVAFQKDPNGKFIRDAAIQRFEYTYELAYKMLKRYLELTEPNIEEIDQAAFPNLIRTGNEKGLLLNNWDQWKVYRGARNITSHTYDEKKANQICEIIPLFLEESQFLLNKLNERMKTL